MAQLHLSAIVLVLILGETFGGPALHGSSPRALSDPRALSAVTELSSRLGARAQDARLPLPTPQELEAIKKVAQILVMLGQQVIPAIIGEPPSGCGPPVVDVPVDAVAGKAAQTSIL